MKGPALSMIVQHSIGPVSFKVKVPKFQRIF